MGTVPPTTEENEMSYNTYEYFDIVQDTEVCVTLGVDIDVDERGIYAGYSIDKIEAANGGVLPTISSKEEEELLENAKAQYLEEIESAKRDDY
jgi:hypothetical protein